MELEDSESDRLKQQNSQDVLAYVKIPHRANVLLLVMATEQWRT